MLPGVLIPSDITEGLQKDTTLLLNDCSVRVMILFPMSY